jgi:hypothetical protein
MASRHKLLSSVPLAAALALAVTGSPAPVQAMPGFTAVAPLAMLASPIAEKYAALGGAGGFLGKSVTSEKTAPDGIGKYQHFEGGSIYWSPQTGAHEVHGLIRARWAELGWEKSWLGYPMTDEIDMYDGHGRVTKFEGGQLIWRGATNKVSDVRATDLLVDLPTKLNEPWKVIQANGGATGSHVGPWVYCYDMIYNGNQPATKGREQVSSATAKVVWVADNATGTTGNNVIVQKLGVGRYASTLHIQQGSYALDDNAGVNFLPQALPWEMRPTPSSGTVLARTGDVGAAAGAYHIHYCITTAPDVQAFKPFESVPFAFRNYEVSNDGGKTWSSVAKGRPRSGQWVRRKGAGAAAEVTASVDVLNFGTVEGQVSLPVGSQAAIGGKVHISVTSAWGEPLASTMYIVSALNKNGPWKYKFSKVPNYKGVKVAASYQGTITPSATVVNGQSGSFDVKTNVNTTMNVSMKAATVR